jgi:RNA polymerase sigma-70 factor (ECF subfamily)
VAVDEHAFQRFISDRVAGDSRPLDPGLYLAFACLSRDPAALAELARMVERAASKVSRSSGLEDAVQQILEKLTAAPEGEAPKLASYAGRGPLEGWIKAVAVRTRLNSSRKRTEELDDNAAAEVVAGPDPQLRFIKAEHRAAFKQAFDAALAALEPDQRTILRLSVLDGLSHQQIARLRGVHQTTITRTIAAARASLLERTRSHLARHLKLGTRDVESVLRDLRSSLEVSLGALLSRPGI